jgi:hypothetical protein
MMRTLRPRRLWFGSSNWGRLPGGDQTRQIARLLAEGFNQRDIARVPGTPETLVASQVEKLRRAFLEQALEHRDELPPGLIERLGG